MVRTRTWRRRLAVAVAGPLALLVGSATGARATVGANDYPYPQGSGVDRWNFYIGQCTSFVAWRLNNDLGIPFTNQYRNPSGNWGDAGHWDDAARSVGIPVDNTPAAGSVAVWDPNVAGAAGAGHVAYVMSVNGDGSINVEEYNWTTASAYDQRHVSAAGLQFIHFTGAVPSGSAGVLRQYTPGADGTWNAWNLSYGNNMHIAGDPFVVGSSVFARSADNTLVQFTPAAGGAWDAWNLSYGNNMHIAGDPFVAGNDVFARSTDNTPVQFTPAAGGAWDAWDLSYGNNTHIAGDPYVVGTSVFAQSS